MGDLLCCPFCGGTAYIRSKDPYIAVECTVCNASTKKFTLSRVINADDRAINAWNRRVEEDGADELDMTETMDKYFSKNAGYDILSQSEINQVLEMVESAKKSENK